MKFLNRISKIDKIQSLLLFSLMVTTTNKVFADDHEKNKTKPAMKMDHKDHKDHKHPEAKAKLNRISKDQFTVKVNGMHCPFCAQGIEKNFGKREEVKSTKVDMDSMKVEVTLKKGKSLEESVIKKIIVDAGFSYEGLVEK